MWRWCSSPVLLVLLGAACAPVPAPPAAPAPQAAPTLVNPWQHTKDADFADAFLRSHPLGSEFAPAVKALEKERAACRAAPTELANRLWRSYGPRGEPQPPDTQHVICSHQVMQKGAVTRWRIYLRGDSGRLGFLQASIGHHL